MIGLLFAIPVNDQSRRTIECHEEFVWQERMERLLQRARDAIQDAVPYALKYYAKFLNKIVKL